METKPIDIYYESFLETFKNRDRELCLEMIEKVCSINENYRKDMEWKLSLWDEMKSNYVLPNNSTTKDTEVK